MWVVRDEDGNLWFGGLTPFCADTLAEIPEILESQDPRVQDRLMPKTYEEPEEEDGWRRYSTPELERLFASRTQLVRRDLETLRQVPDTDAWFLSIQTGHENAWLAALNAVRLALFALHDLDAADMERDPDELECEETADALLKIHFLAEVQMVLIEC